MNEDLKLIKKHYGEAMMHLCRDSFSTILDNSPGLLSSIFLKKFAPNHFLYDDLVRTSRIYDFKNYIYSIYDSLTNEQGKNNNRVENPVTLLKQAGYTLYECLTEEDIQKFKKYYAPGEELCTFKGDRLKYCHVYFAVKDNADKLKRSDFTNPTRQDEYGVSVISIQFTKDDSHTLSIKNRYNHTVANPDATFSNDLDNIIPGLTKSFADHYGMVQQNENINFYPNDYVLANDGKFYRYNYEFDNIYYCPNNIIIEHGQVNCLPKEKYLLIDYFILDLVNKKITNRIGDSFVNTIGNIKKISIINNKDEKIVTITPDDGKDITLVLNKYNRLISLTNNNLEVVPDCFLGRCTSINNVTLNNVKSIGDCFLPNNLELKTITLPKVVTIGDFCLTNSIYIEKINFPLLEEVGDRFMYSNSHLKTLVLPNVLKVGYGFLHRSMGLKNIVMPEVISIGDYSFSGLNGELETISLPNVLKLGNCVFRDCFNVSKVYLPKVKTIGNAFLEDNLKLLKINLPQVEIIGDNFLARAENLKEIIMPNVKQIGFGFLRNVSSLEKLGIPNLECFIKEKNQKLSKTKKLTK